MKEKVLSVRVTESEWNEFHQICTEKEVTAQEMLYACVVDVLWEEREYVRCWEQERRQKVRETSEAGGNSAEGNCDGDHERGPGTEVDL